MIAGTAYCLTKFKNMEDGMRKFMKMFMYCGISTAFWGFMFGSFFGDAVNVIATTFFNRPDIRLAPIWFEPVSLPMKMLVFAFLIGIIHLFTGLGIKFYTCVKNGSLMDGIYDAVFWYMLVGGGIVYLLTMSMFTDMLGLSFTLPAAAGTVAAVLAVIGLIGIVLTSGRESRSWFKRILKGLYGAYGVTSYLSDILSYSRLLALGLATSVISTVFNKMGSMVGGNIPGAIVFILVFLIGHSLNLAINALARMSIQTVCSLWNFSESFMREAEGNLNPSPFTLNIIKSRRTFSYGEYGSCFSVIRSCSGGTFCRNRFCYRSWHRR